MAKIYGKSNGEILRVLRSAQDEAMLPDPPAGANVTVQIDEDVNAAVMEALLSDFNAHDVVGGVLRRNGTPVTLAVSERTTTRALVLQTAQTAVGINIEQLNIGQTRALLALLLYEVGALTATGTVKPLNEWVG